MNPSSLYIGVYFLHVLLWDPSMAMAAIPTKNTAADSTQSPLYRNPLFDFCQSIGCNRHSPDSRCFEATVARSGRPRNG
jgi:hypothetical protein